MNTMLQKFRERIAAELRLAQDELAWWNDLVARGVVKPEHARGYIENENRLIATKRYVLGLS